VISRWFSLALLAAAALAVSGCHGTPQIPTPAHEQAKAQQAAQRDTQREQLDMIPPPAKSRFMAIHSFESWENPYLTVQASVLELHVLQADANPTSYGVGGMLRPTAARRQVLTISPDQLGEALSAIPQSDWPYGRVIALEEAHKVPKAAEPAVRRAMETTVAKLNDLGLVVYDPIEGSVR
jgi:hypothetical protein